MSSRAIGRLAVLFVALFAILAAAQIYVQVVIAPSLEASRFNPMRTNPAQGRGAIVSSDGTLLAESVGQKRVYPEGELLAQTVGYASQRYGEAGLEASFDRFLAAPEGPANPIDQLHAIFDPTAHPPQGARVVTTIDLATQRTLFRELSRYE